jgi:hypothetical protein
MKSIVFLLFILFSAPCIAQNVDENIRLAIGESANKFARWKGDFHKTHWDCKHAFDIYTAVILTDGDALELTMDGHSESVVRQKYARVESFIIGALPQGNYSTSKKTMKGALGEEKTVYSPKPGSTSDLPTLEIFFRKKHDELFELVIRILPV